MKKILIAFLLCNLHNIQASPPVAQWKCFAFDFYGKSFQGLGEDIKHAMRDSRVNCLQHSSRRTTCKTAQSYCEQGPFSEGDNRCVAVDNSGKAFNATGAESCDVAITICDEWQYLHGNPQARNCRIVHR